MNYADMVLLLRKHKLEAIELRYETVYSDVHTVCTLERLYHKAVPVSARAAKLGDEAINKAFKLLARVEDLEKRIGNYLKQPNPEKQPYQNGYCNVPMEGSNEVVRYQRKGEGFAVVELFRTAEDGFVWINEPFPLPTDMKFIRALPDGIGFLSGSAGEAVVRDGKVIKTRMTAIA